MTAHVFRFPDASRASRLYSPAVPARAGDLWVEVAIHVLEKREEIRFAIQESRDRVDWVQVHESCAGGPGWSNFRSTLVLGRWVRVVCWMGSARRCEAHVVLRQADPETKAIIPEEN